MEKQAANDLNMLLKAIEPFAEYNFGKVGKYPPRSKEEQMILRQFQANNFFRSIQPILQNGLNETNILLLDQDEELIYPVKGHFQDSSEPIYDYYQVHKDTLGQNGKIHKATIEERTYLIGTIDRSSHSDTNVKYIVGYSVIPNTDKFLNRVSLLVLGITGLLAIIILPIIWKLASRISDPIKDLCSQAHNIGANHFTRNIGSSNLEEIEALNTAMNEMAIRLESYDRAQKTFFENASHELRTPLMSIRGYAEGIQHGVFEETSYPAQIIMKESDKLATLVDRLLTLSRIDNAKQHIELRSILVAEFLKGRLEVFRPLAEAQGIKINLEMQPIYIVADEYLLESIVDNLLSNSLRYAKSCIDIRMIPEGFVIEDDGKGFSDEDLLHLFERFYKGEGGQTGLGFAIVKSSIEYMGGHIQVDNGPKGAVFRVQFKTPDDKNDL